MHIQSLAIEAIAYDQNARLLRAKYRDSGQTVVYKEVPQEIYDSLIFAQSIGDYFREHIEGQFPRRDH